MTFKDLVLRTIDGSKQNPTPAVHLFPNLGRRPAEKKSTEEQVAESFNLHFYSLDSLAEMFEEGHDIRALLEENLRTLGLVFHYVERVQLCGPIDEDALTPFQTPLNSFYQKVRRRGWRENRTLKPKDQNNIVESLQQAVEVNTELLVQHVEFFDPLERRYHPQPYGRFILVPDRRGSIPLQVVDIADPEKNTSYSEIQDAPSFRSWNRHDLARWVKRERTNVLYGNKISPMIPPFSLADRALGFYYEKYIGSRVRGP
jgi:hypothetical protein